MRLDPPVLNPRYIGKVYGRGDAEAGQIYFYSSYFFNEYVFAPVDTCPITSKTLREIADTLDHLNKTV